MKSYVAFDVSKQTTHAVVMAADGRVLKRQKLPTEPLSMLQFVKRYGGAVETVGLETGPWSVWLYHELSSAGLPVVCMDAFHAHRTLSAKLNKTDAKDAEGLADLLRVNYYRAVHVKSWPAYHQRGLLQARNKLVAQRTSLQNHIRGMLGTFGIQLGTGSGSKFARLVEDALQTRPELGLMIEPLLTAWQVLRTQAATLFKTIRAKARRDADCQRLMTMPGVGPIVATSFVAMIDVAGRFASSRSVGAYLGLTPKRYQSGQHDHQGRISRAGDRQMRGLLFEAAQVLMFRAGGKADALQHWARNLAARTSRKKALVALARRMAVIMHAMLINQTDFQDQAAG